MSEFITTTAVAAESSSPTIAEIVSISGMESRDHISNGVSPKNHRSRINNFNHCTMKKVFLILVALIGFGISVNAQSKFNTKQTVCWTDGVNYCKIEFNIDGTYKTTFNHDYEVGTYRISECKYIYIKAKGSASEIRFDAELINCNSLKSLLSNTWKLYTKETCKSW